jgi:hypothetical protein
MPVSAQILYLHLQQFHSPSSPTRRTRHRMQRARDKLVDQFLDITAGVDDRYEEEDEDDGDDGDDGASAQF